MRNDFAVFILSHGRPDNIKTLKSLERSNYTGKWYIIIDNEDKQADRYYELYGNHVIMFDKIKDCLEAKWDTADNTKDRRVVGYARNASFEIARNLGLKYFLELDDDYTTFAYRVPVRGLLKGFNCLQADRLFTLMIDFLESTNATTVAFAQGGDLFGGVNSSALKKGLLRKAMNTFFCSVDRPFQFVGTINEDVNTYTSLGSRGHLFFTYTHVAITQGGTQQNKGGMTDIYLDNGTYLKSFYSVIFMPSAVKVALVGMSHQRLHHAIKWNNCVPKILSESYKK